MPLKKKIENNKETKTNRKVIKGENNMKYVNKKILTLGMGFVLTYTANAAGTAQGTSISNTATVNYQVSAVPQTAINSTADAFLVDRKVIFTVTSTGNESVGPGETGQVLGYTLSHTGNYTADFAVAAINDTGDNFNPSASSVFVESGATLGYQVLEDIGTHVNELAADGTATVYIVSTIPISATNGQIAKMHLEATAHNGNGAGTLGSVLSDDSGSVDAQGTVQNVFADTAGTATGDTANDGVHSDDGDYTVSAAVITITKTSSVISDGVSVANFKRIPGAVVEYTITVSNAAGAATATNIVVTDTVPANTAFLTTGYGAGNGLQVDGAAEDNDATAGGTSSPDVGDYNLTNAGAITASLGSIAANTNKIVRFRVTVQ